MTNHEKGELGEQFVQYHLKNNGYKLIDVPSKKGYDIAASKNGDVFTFEVKTTSNLSGGIPDMHDSEFFRKNDRWYFIADYLYVVRLDGYDMPLQIDILSKSVIDSFAESHKTVTRIRTTKLDTALKKKLIGESTILLRKIKMACSCDKPLCRKCLMVNCQDDNCLIHTKERKADQRKKLDQDTVVQDMK